MLTNIIKEVIDEFRFLLTFWEVSGRLDEIKLKPSSLPLT